MRAAAAPGVSGCEYHASLTFPLSMAHPAVTFCCHLAGPSPRRIFWRLRVTQREVLAGDSRGGGLGVKRGWVGQGRIGWVGWELEVLWWWLKHRQLRVSVHRRLRVSVHRRLKVSIHAPPVDWMRLQTLRPPRLKLGMKISWAGEERVPRMPPAGRRRRRRRPVKGMAGRCPSSRHAPRGPLRRSL